MFQACYDILKAGGAIGIYPEGTTHSEPRIRKIKTGAARIALETENLYHRRSKSCACRSEFFSAQIF